MRVGIRHASLWFIALLAMVSGGLPGHAQDEFGLEGLDEFGAFGAFGAAPDPGGESISLAAQFTPATEDRPAVLMVTADIQPGWHTYSITQPDGGPLRTEIAVQSSSDFRLLGKFATFPKPVAEVKTTGDWKGVRVEEHSGRITWYVPIEITQGVDPQDLTIEGTVTVQMCTDSSCMPPEDFKFQAELGEGVEIGPVRIDPVAAASVKQLAEEVLATPPAEAGVFSADKSSVTWYGWLDTKTVKPGERAHLYLRAEMPEKWHINAYAPQKTKSGGLATLLALETPEGLTWFQPIPAKPPVEKASPVEGFGLLRYHEGVAIWRIPIDAASTMQSGTHEISGVLGYQACESTENEFGQCEFPAGISFKASLTVGDATEAAPASLSFVNSSYDAAAELAAKFQPPSSTLTQPLGAVGGHFRIVEFSEGAGDLGLVGVLLAALMGGMLLNLMPCVLPVLGLKIMAFAKQGGESKLRVFGLNLTYVAGLMFVFLLLATLASLAQLGLATESLNWGELNTETWFKVSMTALVFAMALSFLGVWEIPIPGFVGGSAAADLASREGYSGAFLKGILTTILATPCSGPFLGPVFGYTIGQGVGMTFLIFSFIGLGMALPYLVIGANPSLIRWIPKPGAWMDTFKQFMAFVLLATVVWLFSTINPEHFIPTLSLMVAIWFACWLGGSQPWTAPVYQRLLAWTGGIAVAVGVGVLGFVEREQGLEWQDFSAAALVDAQADGKTVMLDFTANWCLTCKLNLANAIDVPSVQSVVERNEVIPMLADWTDKNQEIKDALLGLGSRSIPLLAIYPADRPGEVIVLRDVVSEKQVLQALSQAGATKGNSQRWFSAKPEAPSEDSRVTTAQK